MGCMIYGSGKGGGFLSLLRVYVVMAVHECEEHLISYEGLLLDKYENVARSQSSLQFEGRGFRHSASQLLRPGATQSPPLMHSQ